MTDSLFFVITLFLIFNHLTYADNSTIHCDSWNCYQDVNRRISDLSNLIDRFNATSAAANVTKIYDMKDIDKSIRKNENIFNQSMKLENDLNKLNKNASKMEREVLKDQNKVEQMLEKLSNFSKNYNEINQSLTTATSKQTELINLLKIAENSSETCTAALREYSKLKQQIDDVNKKYDNVNSYIDETTNKVKAVNRSIDEATKEALNIKNKLGELKLPNIVADEYLLKSETKMNDTITHLKTNVDLLKQLLNSSKAKLHSKIKNQWDKVKDNITALQTSLGNMSEALRNYEKKFTSDKFEPTVNDESRKRLKEINKTLSDLEEKFKKIDFTDEEKRLIREKYSETETNLSRVKNKMTLLKNYGLIADEICNINVKEIKEENDKLNKTIGLYEKWRLLQDELELLRLQKEEVLKINSTATGLLE